MSVIDVSELFSGPDSVDFMRTVVLRRPTVHLANEGEEIASYDPDVSFSASVQPATAEETASLPEGERGSGRVIKLYSATEPKMSDGKTTIADVVAVDGGSFRVVGVEPWGAHGYFKVLAAEFIRVIDDLAYSVRKLVRTVFAMPANSVRPAKQHAPAGGQVDEMATVDIINDTTLGTGARSYETVGTVPDDVTTERVESEHMFVASVNFYRRPPTSSYLRGFTVSADPDDYTAIDDGGFDITIDGTLRQVELLDFSGATTMDGIAAIIQTRLQAELASTRCAWDAVAARFVVTSPTTAQTSAVSGASASTIDNDPDPDPTDVSAVLGLTIAGGALSVNNRAGIARYSNAAFDRAARLEHKLRMSSALMLMNQLGLSFVHASPPRNLAALVDGDTWESRGQVDLTFTVVNRETATVETILTVPLTVKAQAPGGAVHSQTTEVTA